MSPLYEYLRLLVIGVVIGFPVGIGIGKAIDGEEGSVEARRLEELIVEATKPPGHMLLVPTDSWHPPMLYAPPLPAWSVGTVQFHGDAIRNGFQADEMK